MDLTKAFKDNGNEVDVYMFSGNTHKEDGVNYINIDLLNINGEADEYVVQENFKNFETDQSYLNLAKKLEDKINIIKKYKNNDETIFVTSSKFYANEYSKLAECKINFIPHTIDRERLKTHKPYEEIC